MSQPTRPHQLGLLDWFISAISIGVGLLLAAYLPIVATRRFFGASTTDGRLLTLPIGGAVLIVFLNALMLGTGGHRSRERGASPGVAWLAVSSVLALLWCGFTILVESITTGYLSSWIKRAATVPVESTGRGHSSSWISQEWHRIVPFSAVAIACLCVVLILFNDRYKSRLRRASRAMQFVMLFAPFMVAWQFGMPLWATSLGGLAVAIVPAVFTDRDCPNWLHFSKAAVGDAMIGIGLAGAVYVYWKNWVYGVVGTALLFVLYFIAAKVAEHRHMSELRAIGRRVSYSSTGKKCMACGREVPSSSTVGEKCPHCGRVWGATIGGG